MYKTFTILALVVIVLSIVSFFFFRTKDNNNYNNNYNNETNTAVRELVDQLIIVQYRTHNLDVLKKLLTESLFQNIEKYYPNFMRKKVLYSIDNNYMQSLYYYENDNRWYVSVRINEGLFEEEFFLKIGITHNEDGSYIISFIGIDA
jgi:hypothetical protein